VFYSADAHRRDDEVFLRNPSANTGTSISASVGAATTSSAAANAAKNATHPHTATESHTAHPASSGVNAPGGALPGAPLVRMSHGAAPEVTPKHNPASGAAGESTCVNVVWWRDMVVWRVALIRPACGLRSLPLPYFHSFWFKTGY
jgi:hypothetical protein